MRQPPAVRVKTAVRAVGMPVLFWMLLLLPVQGGTAHLAAGQTPIALKFEVASVKPAGPGGSGPPGSVRMLPGGRLSATAATLNGLVQWAYNLRFEPLFGGPHWAEVERFDIEAVPGHSVSREEWRQMLQALLEERFQVKAHRETRVLPVYFLVPAKNGLKLSPPQVADCASKTILGFSPCGNVVMSAGAEYAEFNGYSITMESLADTLSGQGHIFIDKTGFAGKFDLHIRFKGEGFGSPSGDTTSSYATLAEVLADQLGIKVESGRASREVFIIDHAEKPTTK